MADRTVSVELKAQVGDFVAEMNIAGSAVDRFNQKVDGASRDTGQAFTRTGRDVGRSTSQISASLEGLGNASAGFASKAEEQNLRAALAAQKMGLAAREAAEKAAAAQKAAAVASDRLAAGEIDVEEHAQAVARAEREVERATIRTTEAQLAASAAARKLDEDTQRAGDSFSNADKSATLMRGELTSLIAAAAGIAPPLIAAGAAAGAFAAVAAPSIKEVIDAQKDLNAGWSTLDKGQQATSQHLNDLIDQYQALADAYEPQALAVFNDLLGDTSVLMQRARPLLDASALGISHFTGAIDSFVTGGEMTQFLNFATHNAGPAFEQLGNTFTETGTLALNLIQDLTPMGMTLLTTANGGLRLLNAVEQINPHLAEMAVTALALRTPTQALGSLWTNNASKLSKLAKEGSKAESFLGKLGKTVGSSPNLYIGLALAAGYVVARLATMKDSTDNLIASIRTENSAIGNNAAGHLAAAASFNQYIAKARAARDAALADGQSENSASSIVTHYGEQIKKLTAARKDELAAAHNITTGESDLASQYNITAQQANQLATAAGVDLSKGITGSGDAAKAAQAKIRAYFNAVQQAQNPTYQISQALTAAGNSTLALKDRMQALTNAWNAMAGPAIQAFDATTKQAQAFAQLDQALKKSHGSLSQYTAAGQNARGAFAQLYATLEQNIQAQYQYTSTTQGAEKANAQRAATTRALVPLLLAEAGSSKSAQQAVLAFAQSGGLAANSVEDLISQLGMSKSAFLAAARQAGISKQAADALWNSFEKLSSKPVIMRLDDRDFLYKLHNAQGLKVDPKTGYLLGNNSNYFNSWLKANGLRIDPKTGLFKGNNADYYNKWLKANGLKIDTKTGRIVGNTSAFWAAVHAIPSVVGHRTITVTYSYQGSAGGRKQLTPAQNRADGGIDRYADGGLRRDLEPFVALTPTVLFGETSTGGEAFIPLGMNKRKRSTELLSQVANMFGLEVVKSSGVLRRYDDGTVSARQLHQFVRQLIPAGAVNRPTVSAASTANGGTTINQTIYAQQMDPHELARNVANETAWAVG